MGAHARGGGFHEFDVRGGIPDRRRHPVSGLLEQRAQQPCTRVEHGAHHGALDPDLGYHIGDPLGAAVDHRPASDALVAAREGWFCNFVGGLRSRAASDDGRGTGGWSRGGAGYRDAAAERGDGGVWWSPHAGERGQAPIYHPIRGRGEEGGGGGAGVDGSVARGRRGMGKAKGAGAGGWGR